MPMIYRVLFTACASFGPMLMVIGLQGRTTFGFVCAGTGALMTSTALFMLFDRIVDGTRTVTPPERRDQLLYWCVVVVIGVLIWLLTEWVVPLR
ncbi:MAG: hypothetical protein NTV05_06265 [Acidobacteria bacterium]|nr:hypothetical protein [Acidobacteriota bacterium]